MKILASLAAVFVLASASQFLLPSASQAATWEYTWQGGDKTPTVEISPLKYGKTWVYGVELDDGPATTLTVVKPLLSQFSYSDAPAGVGGGQAKPFVGTAAIFLSRFDTGNNTLLSKAQLRELVEGGWSVVSHSYWHTGNHWDASKALKPADFRRELFWSQALWPAVTGQEQASVGFVYPNGDYNYGKYLAEYGLRSGSLVGGKLQRLPATPDEWMSLDRNWLDENVWSKNNDPLEGLPKTGPKAGDVIVDFTHGIDANPQSANRQRWQKRLETIAGQYGIKGDDSMWCAPTDEIVAYDLGAKNAKIEAERGKVRVSLPDTFVGTPLTLHLTGIDTKVQLKAPVGGVLYRKGEEVWITTPTIGKAGVPVPAPKIERIYQGEVKNVTFEKPRKIAGVRLRQAGAPKEGFALAISAVGAAGTASIVPADKASIGSNWGTWQLYPTIPDGAAPLANEIQINSDPCLKEMEVWAVVE